MMGLLRWMTFLLFLSCQALDNHSGARLKAAPHFLVVNENRDTIFKLASTMIIDENRPDDIGIKYCKLYAETNLLLAKSPELTKDRHLKVTLASPLMGCGLQEGYVSTEDVETSLQVNEDVTPVVKAFLDTIAYAEGTENSYNYIYTHTRFSSYRNHPRAMKCSGGLCSDAAGRYQFLSSTWAYLAKKSKLKDFSPASQDIACLQLIDDEGFLTEVENSSRYASFERAVYGLSKQWASLPGAPYGQPVKTMDELWRYYQSKLLDHSLSI